MPVIYGESYDRNSNDAYESHSVWGFRELDVSCLEPAADEIERDGTIACEERVDWEHETLLLMRLNSQNRVPHLKGKEAGCEQSVRIALE